jgi:hypothetical protein
MNSQITQFSNLFEISAILTKSTRVHVRQGVKDIEMGVNLHQPIFHPIVQNPPKSAVVGLESMTHLVDRIAKVNYTLYMELSNMGN